MPVRQGGSSLPPFLLRFVMLMSVIGPEAMVVHTPFTSFCTVVLNEHSTRSVPPFVTVIRPRSWSPLTTNRT